MNESFTASHRGGSGAPLVLLHGFTDTWRTWDLVLPELERNHDVLAPTLPCHAGGPALEEPTLDALTDAVEAAMDEAGFASVHVVGNFLDNCGQLAHLDRPTDTVRLVREWVSVSVSAGSPSER